MEVMFGLNRESLWPNWKSSHKGTFKKLKFTVMSLRLRPIGH
jgi:hypothetical protein